VRRLRRNLRRTGVGVAVSAVLGTVATTPSSDWYLALDKPSWQPPPIAFPLVWTPLYADIAIASAVALTRLEQAGRTADAAALRRALGVNLALNTGWSVLFWRSRRPWVATAWCALLAGQSVDLVRRVSAADPRSGAAIAPYPAWCAFATALNASIARRNARAS
jgi:benzodiazapine receptor